LVANRQEFSKETKLPINEHSNDANTPAVRGENTVGPGVYGTSQSQAGVVGESQSFHAVYGSTHSTFAGVYGASDAGGDGVAGESKAGRGVHGISETGDGVFGTGRRGIVGESDTYQGVYGRSRDNAGVVGESQSFHAVYGSSHSSFAGVFGTNDAGGDGVAGESNTGIGVHGKGGRLAGFFEGDVEVTGDIRLTNADCAEDFDIAGVEIVEPGTVMVLGNEGTLQPSDQAYDKRVAGVISGGGDYKPGIVLDKQSTQGNRSPVALLGKVYCKVDASYAPIEVGDLLTTSLTPGHAMKADDPRKAFGAVIGKALRPLKEGQALIPILIALQ
jgi:hypothetical protein